MTYLLFQSGTLLNLLTLWGVVWKGKDSPSSKHVFYAYLVCLSLQVAVRFKEGTKFCFISCGIFKSDRIWKSNNPVRLVSASYVFDWMWIFKLEKSTHPRTWYVGQIQFVKSFCVPTHSDIILVIKTCRISMKILSISQMVTPADNAFLMPLTVRDWWQTETLFHLKHFAEICLPVFFFLSKSSTVNN